MSTASIEVTIEEGRIVPVQPHLLPERGRGWLTLSTVSGTTEQRPEVRLETTEDGLPVLRGNGPVITSELVREIEGSTV